VPRAASVAFWLRDLSWFLHPALQIGRRIRLPPGWLKKKNKHKTKQNKRATNPKLTMAYFFL